MKLRRLSALTFAIIALSSCANSVRPFSDKRELSRAEAHDVARTAEQMAFADGKEAGQKDRINGDPDSYRRHSPLYRSATEKAFADGYREGYHAADAATGPARDEGYNQGYDYGMRDRARKKPSDPEAHIGEYDAKLRASFERGYLDGYNR